MDTGTPTTTEDDQGQDEVQYVKLPDPYRDQFSHEHRVRQLANKLAEILFTL